MIATHAVSRKCRHSAIEEEAPVVMVLPFVLGLLATLLALSGYRTGAMRVGLATVVVQVWWLLYHATDKLAVTL